MKALEAAGSLWARHVPMAAADEPISWAQVLPLQRRLPHYKVQIFIIHTFFKKPKRSVENSMKMEDGRIINGGGGGGSGSRVEIYPLNRYYFASKETALDRGDNSDGRIQRLRSNYAAHGLRTCVQGVLLVELFQQPHVLLLQVRNSVFSLPGGRLRPGEIDTKGLKRKLSRKLSRDDSGDDDWEVGECIGMWWRSDFETLPYPYMPRKSKECTKLFLVRLPMTWQFAVPRNMKLLAVPLCQLHDNYKTYGPIISGIPQLLSKYSFSIVQD